MATLTRTMFRFMLRRSLDVAVAAILAVAISQRVTHTTSGSGKSAAIASVSRARPPIAIIIANVYREIVRDRVVAVAAGVAFFALLSLFPALAVLVSTYGLVASPSDMADLMASTGTLLPAAANDMIGAQIEQLAAASKASLSIAWAGALMLSLWSANSATKALIDALSVAYNVDERRGFILYNCVSILFTLGAVVLMVGLLLAFAAVPVVLNGLWLGWASEMLINYGRWPVLLVVLVTGISLLYRFGPNRPTARWRWITPGSVLASTGLMMFSFLFSWYAVNFGHYNETYGSLGAVIVFMTWTWLSTMIVLVGAELNAELVRMRGNTRKH